MKRIEYINNLKQLKQKGKYFSEKKYENWLEYSPWYNQVCDNIFHLIDSDSVIRDQLRQIIPDPVRSDIPEKIPEYADFIIQTINSVLEQNEGKIIIDEKFIEDEVSKRVHEFIKKSWVFRVLIVILGLTIGFAILGVIKIESLKFDVNEFTESKISELKKNLDSLNTSYILLAEKYKDNSFNKIDSVAKKEINNLIINSNSEFSTYLAKRKTELGTTINGMIDSSLIRVGYLKKQIDDNLSTIKEIETTINDLYEIERIDSNIQSKVPILIEKYELYNWLLISVIALFVAIIILLAIKIFK